MDLNLNRADSTTAPARLDRPRAANNPTGKPHIKFPRTLCICARHSFEWLTTALNKLNVNDLPSVAMITDNFMLRVVCRHESRLSDLRARIQRLPSSSS